MAKKRGKEWLLEIYREARHFRKESSRLGEQLDYTHLQEKRPNFGPNYRAVDFKLYTHII